MAAGVLKDPRHEDLAAMRLFGDPGRHGDGAPDKVVTFPDDLAGVQSDADPDRGIGVRRGPSVKCLLDPDRATESAVGAGEGDHEPVALGFDLEPTAGGDLAPDDVVVLLKEGIGSLVTQAFGQ